MDSIALMQIAEELQRLPGIEAAAVVMGTPANTSTTSRNFEGSCARPHRLRPDEGAVKG